MATSVNHLLKRLQAASDTTDEVSSEWMTFDQFCARVGRSINPARKLLLAGVLAGVLESKPFRVKDARGRVITMTHYREIPSKK